MMRGLVLTAVLVENVVYLVLDPLTVVLTLDTELALATYGSVDKGVTRYIVSGYLNSHPDLLERKCFGRPWPGGYRLRIDLH